MMKRVLIGIVCVMMLMLSACPVSAEETTDAPTVNFSLIANDAVEGESVIVTVSIPENTYFTNATLYLHYDPTVVSYVTDSVAGGAISPSFAMVLGQDYPEEGYVKTVYVTVDGIVEGGELITYEFVAKSNAPAQFSLSFDECMGVDANETEFNIVAANDPIVINSDGSVVPTAPAVTTTAAKEETDGMNTTALLIVAGVAVVLVAGITVTMLMMKKKSK